MRAHLEAAARRGHADAIAALEGPPVPEALYYLYDWVRELDLVRRYDMSGPQALSYTEIDAWARLTDRHPAPHEVRALVLLDRVLLHPVPTSPTAKET